ncbi:MAG: hypothetical protein DI539_08635 [Flavobacterium psychrophilum]|nr:MAG: hypothetical protein DI539_08635 [Flavobacterium psychrophilum]
MKKVLLVLFVLVSFSGSVQAVANTSQDDNLILTTVINNTKRILKGEHAMILLSPSANNGYIINMIEKYRDKVSDVLFEADHNDEILQQIFNEKEYGYLLSQRSDEKWNLNGINEDKVIIYKEDMDIIAPGSKVLTVGKPIYTLDNKYALVYLNLITWLGIQVFKNEGGKWIEYKLIHPLIVQPKLKKMKGYCVLLEKILLDNKVADYLHGDKNGRETLYVIENDFCVMDTEINNILVKTVKDVKAAKNKNYIDLKIVKELDDKTVVELLYPIEGVSVKAVFDSKRELLDIDIIEK